MSAYIDITLGEVKTHYRTTFIDEIDRADTIIEASKEKRDADSN